MWTKKVILAVGSIINGYVFYGPFDTMEDALAEADEWHTNDEFYTIWLCEPKTNVN